MSSNEKEILGDPEDAVLNSFNGHNEEPVRSPRAQEPKFLEMRFDQDVTIKLPKAPVHELVSSVGLMSAAISIPDSPSIMFQDNTAPSGPSLVYIEDNKKSSDKTIMQPETRNTDESSVSFEDVRNGKAITRQDNDVMYNPLATQTVVADVSNTDQGLNIAKLPQGNDADSELANGNLERILLANQRLDVFVNSTEEEKCHDNVYDALPNPSFDRGVKVLGVVNLGTGDLIGVSPISNTKAWIYGCKRFNLVDLESGEVLKSYLAPSIVGLQLYAVDESIVLVDTFVDRSLEKMTIEGDCVVDIQPFIIIDSKKKNEDRTFGRLVECYAVSNCGYVLACMFRKETCCCCTTKDILVITRFDNAGRYVREKKALKGRKSCFRQSVTAMKINRNGDICLVGSNSLHGHDVHVAVFTSDVKFRFTYPPDPKYNVEKCGMYDIATDSQCNILVGYYGVIDVIDSNGKFLITLKSDFGVHGSSRSLSVGPDGKAWVCTEPGRVVVLEYSTRPITENV